MEQTEPSSTNKISYGGTYPSGFKSPTRSLLEVLVGVEFVYVFS